MTFVELTERYGGNSRARRAIAIHRTAHEALLKLARQLRDERHMVSAEATDMLAKLLLHQAKRCCEAAAMPVTDEVVAREREVERG